MPSMRRTIIFLWATLPLLLLLSRPGLPQSFEEDAEVLPKGVTRFRVDDRIYLPTSTRFDQDGKRENAAANLNATLNSSVFPNLSLVEAAFRMPAGTANIGRSVVSYKYDFNTLTLGLDYGLLDKVTIGVRVPIWFVQNSVQAHLDTSRATVGKNAFLNTLAPLSFSIPGFPTVPLTTRDVQNLLGRGLDINGDGRIDIRGFGYQPVRTWRGQGFSDIEAGFRWQYFKNRFVRLAFTGGVRFPTGSLDDPDNLADYPFGRGAFALLFRLNNDLIYFKNFLWNVTLKYDFYLPDSQLLRVPASVDNPLTLNKFRVNRWVGDIIEVETNIRYTFLKCFDVSFLYIYGFKLRDKVWGSRNISYRALEDETDYAEHIYRVGLTFSSLPLYQEKKFPVPFTLSVQYRDRFAGRNNVLATQYIRVLFNVFF
ncbi:MAG: hypothetical protein FJ128_05530 [Deltaproteobacteria bacterium]|nr:hypothetical protein [Deltaproteobacteria bacterium]